MELPRLRGLKGVVGLGCLLASVAWADPADDLRACQGQLARVAQQAALIREIREYYEARLAEALARLEAAEATLKNRAPGP